MTILKGHTHEEGTNCNLISRREHPLLHASFCDQQGNSPAPDPDAAHAGSNDLHAALLRRAHGRDAQSGRAKHRHREQDCRLHRQTPDRDPETKHRRRRQSRPGLRPDSISERQHRRTQSPHGKVSKQLDDLQAAQQTIAANSTQSALATKALTDQQTAPPPDVLYNNGLRDYTSGKTDLATQEFNDYLKFYPNTDLAGNASFYLAEIEFKAGGYAQAAKDYDKVLENFPSGNKVAAAHLKKGYSLAELGQKDAAVAELQTLIQRFPRAPEAAQAKEKLQQLGVSTTPTRKAR